MGNGAEGERRPRAFSLNAITAAALLIALLSLVAILLRNASLGLPFRYPMELTAAVVLLPMAVGLVAIDYGLFSLAKVTGITTACAGLIALGTQWLRWTSAFDPMPGALGSVSAGIQTAFSNSLCFVTMGIALALLSTSQVTSYRGVLASIGGSTVLTIGLCSLVNELLQVVSASPTFEGESAVDASLAVAMAGFAIVRVSRGRLALTDEYVTLRRPPILAVVGALAAFLMWRFLLQERSVTIADYTANVSTAVFRALTLELNSQLQAVGTAAYGQNPPGMQLEQDEVGWLDLRTGGTVSISAGSQHPAYTITDPMLFRRLTAAGNDRQAMIAVFKIPSQPARVLFAAPVYSGDALQGFRAVTRTLTDVFEPLARMILGPNYQLFYVHNGVVEYLLPSPPTQYESRPRAETAVNALGGAIFVYPTSWFARRAATWASHMVLAIGLAVSFLLALSDHLVNVARDRLEQVQSARRRLESEVEERKKAEIELERQARLLQASNADLREFAHVASHDLQEPLRSINGFAQLLVRRYKNRLDDEADEFLDYITQATLRMSGMIQGLLAYSRVINASEPTENVHLQKAVDWANSNLNFAIEESEAEISVEPLPVVHGHPLLLGQLFQNLIGNAIKYRGQQPLKISIRCCTHDGEHVVSVSDNGIGIHADSQTRIFGLFKRGHAGEYPGTGVGLALCKRIVERHGGRMWVESKPGAGSTFFFTVPQTAGDLSTSQASA